MSVDDLSLDFDPGSTSARFINGYYYYAPWEVEVDRVVDGDTLDIIFSVDVGFKSVIQVHQRVRLSIIDTPEIYGVSKGSEQYEKGIRMKNKMEQLLEDHDFWLRTRKNTGKFGRYLGEFYLVDVDEGPKFLQEKMAQYMDEQGIDY